MDASKVLFIASALDDCRKLKDGGEDSIEELSSGACEIELSPKRLEVLAMGRFKENDDDNSEALNSLSGTDPEPLIKLDPKISDKTEESACKLELRLELKIGPKDGVKAID